MCRKNVWSRCKISHPECYIPGEQRRCGTGHIPLLAEGWPAHVCQLLPLRKSFDNEHNERQRWEYSREDSILYLNRKDVELVSASIDSVALMRDLFKLHGSGQTLLPDEAYLGWTNDRGEQVRSLNMPGYIGGSLNVAGTKIINGNIANPTRGLPRASGLTLIYDKTSVRINCIMEGAYLSSLRTACVTALSADIFLGRDIESVALHRSRRFGSGSHRIAGQDGFLVCALYASSI